MTFLATLRIALTALRRNKGRSLLTALGIIIGIAAVIAVVAVTQGADSMTRQQIATMGNNILTIRPEDTQAGGFRGGSSAKQSLTAPDAAAIEQECAFVAAASPIVRYDARVVFRENNWKTDIYGVGTSYLEVRNWTIDAGNFFSDSDVPGGSRVCVLGSTVAEALFADEDPVGKTIRIENMQFQVLGTLAKKGTAAFGQDQDDVILMPWTTTRRVLRKSPFNYVDRILVSATSLDDLPRAREEITAVLRQLHHLAPAEDDNFSVTDMTEVTQMITQVSRVMQWLLTVIASISLVVGGIGIMNIMLVSVTERTREIGLRLAVGARKRDILLQFLAEAILLAAVGGLIGICVGIGIAHIGAAVQKWPVSISPTGILMALGFSAGVGIIFGLYPAWRAARLDPIESLRHE